MRLAEEILETTDYVVRSVGNWLGRDPRKSLDPYTVTDGAVVTRDGTLYSVLQIKGFGRIAGNDELASLVDQWETVLNARMKPDAIHEFDFVFEADELGGVLEDNFAPAEHQSKRMGLSVSDIFDEKKRRYRELCLDERCYLVVYTVPWRLRGSEASSNASELKQKRQDHIRITDSQSWDIVSSFIKDKHREVLESMAGFLERSGYLHFKLTHTEALRVLRGQLLGHSLSSRWQPALVDDKYTPGEINPFDEGDASFLLPKPLFSQVLDHEVEVVGRRFVALGERIIAPVRITQLPTKPTSFDQLVSLLRSAAIPYRVCFTIKPNGLFTNRFDVNVASWTKWASDANSQIESVYRSLSHYQVSNDSPVVSISAMACTWAPLEEQWLRKAKKKGRIEVNVETIRQRTQALINRLNDWGSAHADNAIANPMQAVAATTVGGHRNHYAPVAPAPLKGALGLSPITRVGLPWQQGTMLFRTKDGAILPYEQYSALQSYWITLISGPMGYGKSSQIASHNFAFLTQPADSTNLPILRGIDIGPSQLPVVDLIRDALPERDKHQAVFIQFENSKRHAANPFDLPLGFRRPAPEHRTYLTNFVTSICSSLSDWPSLPGLAAAVVDGAYSRFDASDFNPDAPRYVSDVHSGLDQLIERHGIPAVSRKTPWAEVSDALFDAGEVRAAKIAQRYAVPTLPDLDSVAQTHDIISEYPDLHSSGVTYIDLFSRCIREAVRLFPFLARPTNLDLSDSPVAIIDLSKVIQKSSDPTVLAQNAIYFMVVFRMLTADFFMDETMVELSPERYKGFHKDRCEYLKSCKKRFFGDEVHRYSSIPSAEAQLEQIAVEARKFFIDLLLGSQVVTDFPSKLRALASTVIMCGAGAPSDVKSAQDEYGLNKRAAAVLSGIKMPTKDGAEFLMMVDNKQVRRQVIHGINTEGPRFLWAIATNAPDRSVRDMLSERLGDTSEARRVLAARYPSGEIRTEQARRQRMLGQAGDDEKDILRSIVDELVEDAHRRREVDNPD